MWWENTFLRLKGRTLYLGRVSAEQVAKRNGSPVFVYSRAQISSNYQILHRTFSKHLRQPLRIAYAMKANPHREILKMLQGQGAWIDAVSPQEVEEARRSGYPASRILFTGTSLSGADLERVFRIDGLTVNIDALEQLEVMRELRAKGFREKKIRVAVRWNPGIGRGFNPKVITAGVRSSDGTPVKFGVEESKVLTALERAASYGFLPVGLHQHLGSGWVNEDFEVVSTAVDKMVSMARRIEKGGFRLEFLDFGGGFGPRYQRHQSIFPLDKYASHIARQIAGSGLGIEAVVIEPGKYLVADAGVLLLRVEYLKESYGQLFACVNAGTFNSLPRPAIYPQAQHHIVNCGRVFDGRMKTLTIAGNLCETGDVFAREIRMPVPQRGDVLAILCAGAYGRSMASRFNLRDIPPEVLI
ncbi:MAG: diaminopimelate decarboxylase [Candidatus Aminicenantes bacterium]|nr:diaminopimelate decarboxylase [Candidatus Aminicenantes bacterium]